MKKQKKLPYRTTLSMTKELGNRFETIASSRKLTPGELARIAVQQYVEVEELRRQESTCLVLEPMKEIIEMVRSLSSGHHYQGSVARWRLSRTVRQIEGITRCDLSLDALPAEVYLTRALGELHADLGSQDEFLVLTNLRFWGDFSGTFLEAEAGNYLQAQRSAVERGMRLLRVFLLSNEDTPSQREKLKPHFEFLNQIARGCADRVQVKFMQCGTKTELDNAIQHIGHFACIRRRGRPTTSLPSPEPDTGCLVVEPLYCVPGRIKELRLLFSHGPSHEDEKVRPYVSRLLQVASNARPLEEIGRANPSK